jgi:hypothetical protein
LSVVKATSIILLALVNSLRIAERLAGYYFQTSTPAPRHHVDGD